MKLKYIALFVLCIGTVISKAQINERFKKKDSQTTESSEKEEPQLKQTPPASKEPSVWDKFLFGGNMSLTFGRNTFVYIAPTVGYKATEKIIVGGGFIYQYTRFTEAYNPFTNQFEPFEFETSVYGPKAIFTFIPNDFLYVGTQIEYLNHDVANFATNDLDRQWTTVLFLEGGIIQKIGKKSFVQLGMRYNLLHDVDSPYGVAFIPTIGFFF